MEREMLMNMICAFAASPVFGGFDTDRLTEICGRLDKAGALSVRRFAKGERVGIDDADGALVIVTDGRLSVCRADTEGGGSVVLNVLQRGGCFGVSSILPGSGRPPATVISAVCDSAAVFISGGGFTELLLSDGDVCKAYIRFLNSRICFLNEKLHTFSGASVGERVAQALLSSAVEHDGALCCDGSMTGLAQRLNIGRASLYRALDAMEERGLISRSGKHIELLDCEGLACFM